MRAYNRGMVESNLEPTQVHVGEPHVGEVVELLGQDPRTGEPWFFSRAYVIFATPEEPFAYVQPRNRPISFGRWVRTSQLCSTPRFHRKQRVRVLSMSSTRPLGVRSVRRTASGWQYQLTELQKAARRKNLVDSNQWFPEAQLWGAVGSDLPDEVMSRWAVGTPVTLLGVGVRATITDTDRLLGLYQIQLQQQEQTYLWYNENALLVDLKPNPAFYRVQVTKGPWRGYCGYYPFLPEYPQGLLQDGTSRLVMLTAHPSGQPVRATAWIEDDSLHNLILPQLDLPQPSKRTPAADPCNCTACRPGGTAFKDHELLEEALVGSARALGLIGCTEHDFEQLLKRTRNLFRLGQARRMPMNPVEHPGSFTPGDLVRVDCPASKFHRLTGTVMKESTAAGYWWVEFNIPTKNGIVRQPMLFVPCELQKVQRPAPDVTDGAC